MHQAKLCATVDFRERQGDDRVEARAIICICVAVVSASPGIAKALVWYHFEHLAMDHAVPRAGRRRLKGEARACRGFEPCRLQQPTADEVSRRQGFPDSL